MHRVMDEYDMKDALVAAIHKHMKINKLTRSEFCESLERSSSWLYQIELKSKVKVMSIDLLSEKIDILFRLTLDDCEYFFDRFDELHSAVAEYCKQRRLMRGQSIMELSEVIGSQYIFFEKKKRLEQPIFFKSLEHIGGKLHVGIGKKQAFNRPSEKEAIIVQLPKPTPGNGKVVNSFEGW